MRKYFLRLMCVALFQSLISAAANAGERQLTGLDVSVLGHHAYVAGGENGLYVVDIRNPANLMRAASIKTPGEAKGVFAAGSFAYVAGGSAGLQIVGIRNPADPVMVGSVDTPGDARGVCVFSDYALVADAQAGLQIISIRDPGRPRIVAAIDTPGEAHQVAVAANHAYVADGLGGLQIITSADLPNRKWLLQSVLHAMRARCTSYPTMPSWQILPGVFMRSI